MLSSGEMQSSKKNKIDRMDLEEVYTASAESSDILQDVYKVILDRKKSMSERSYVASLFRKGTDKIAEKIDEESSELIEAAKERKREDIIHETADLWFHTMVLLGEKEISPEEILGELRRRFGVSGIEEKESRRKVKSKK